MRFTLLVAMMVPSLLQAQVWTHEGKPAYVIELFTSEGCSSCPPADQYLSQYTETDTLWDDYIPLAYHVDYWDYIGWKDRFAHPSYSQKQRLYRSYGVVDSVYTPGFVVNGAEWKGFFSYRTRTLPDIEAASATQLQLKRDKYNYTVTFSGDEQYTAHIAWLAMNEITPVKRGENRGKTLKHDFVVIEKQQKNAAGKWGFSLNNRQPVAQIDAVAVWLTKPKDFVPVQTVAGWIDKP
ncbi:hypothetical protein BCT61_07405 [Vibrio breoganii]|uniref:DUF1223 domain-containing protein n=1 Tax=Vibrio breoganii TaxID=553239 RepID=UPI000C83080B|nr:DUF1223 domain-containing protein [Vibrio breoganii]PMG08755.1 hypothetical protein BCV00_05110 [Vibrio breoganii]PMK20885.1 hypothetical protein BCU06_06070 [Vibrio breoganii]PMK26492.1 hypothetical protein BCU03_02740 [Vibrio breoganii]PMK58220.1 hypothetical protein BCT98_07015 [Vibrio breoganii]PMK71564.1 hypothetical protein BCT94_14415 [Vibrio breoganii]